MTGASAQLGRSVIVADGAAPPDRWADCERITIDNEVVAAPRGVVAQLHEAWASRTPVVINLAVDAASFREPRSYLVEPWVAGARFEPLLDRLHFLVWANSYDARGPGEPIWWWGRKAERLGAQPCTTGQGDVVLAGGVTAWVDGGPRSPLPVELGAVVHRESVDLGRLYVAPPQRPPQAELAPDQLVAVGHGSGPARIIAPAGSGKTRVLTERLRHLLVDREVEPQLILAVAYNRKAQEELETRTEGLSARVRTLNAVGGRLLAQHRQRPPRLLDDRDVRRLVEDLVEIPRSRWKSNTDPLAAYIEALSEVRMALRDPADVELARDDIPGFAVMFPRYRTALAERDAIDFDEQIYATIEALLSDGAFRAQSQCSVRHLLVDEFQDLTPAHVLMLRLLCIPQLDCFGVGDDDQVIYGHAGADPAFLLEFGQLFPGAAEHALEVNYRCAVPIVDGARTLLGYNHRRVPKLIRPSSLADTDSAALLVRTHSIEHGASELVQTVQRWLEEPAVTPESIAVLVRVNSLMLAPQVALAEAGIPALSTLTESVLERTGLKAALAYLRIGSDPKNVMPADVVEILRRPTRGLPQWFPDRLRRRQSWTMHQLRDIGNGLPDKDADKVDRLVNDLQLVATAVSRGPTAHALRTIRDQVGLGTAMEMLDQSKGGEGSSHLDDLEALVQVAALQTNPVQFESWLRARLQDSAKSGITSGITLSTIHKVKGREWDRVVLFGATAGIVPHRLAEDEEEERRIFHVGITRGRHRVVVLGDEARPSSFLAELAGSAPTKPAAASAAPASAGIAAPRRAPAVKPDLNGADEGLFEALRIWRSQRSKKDKVSAFIVAPDRTLLAIIKARPATFTELSRVDGIGPTKLENYGDEILEVLLAASA